MMVAAVVALLSVIGCLQCIAGWIAVARFAGRPSATPAEYPPVTILKPLYGAEPLLEEALASCCRQAYPTFQIVFGVRDEADPALVVARRLQARFSDCDITIVVDPALYGTNRKVSNLINMLPSARHDLLVISDSDLHLPADYIAQLVAELEKPRTGLVTAAYVGLPPADLGWCAELGATHITHGFLPGVLLSRALGREDCLGSTTMLSRDTLSRIGGLGALVDVLAEDNIMGQRVRDLGLTIGLADTLVAATVPEPSLPALWHHEVRWTRTIRATAPWELAGSTLQYPRALWSVALFGGGWAVRAICMIGIDRAVRRKTERRLSMTAAWLPPIRDILSVVEIGASYGIGRVWWRGHEMSANGLVVNPIVPQLEV
jgi:ceramide glucosyltransferase